MPRNTPQRDDLLDGWGKENRAAPRREQQDAQMPPQTVYDDPPSSPPAPRHRHVSPPASSTPSKGAKSKYPLNDNRWPIPHTSESEILKLKRDDASTNPIYYILIHQNSDPEAKLMWKGEVVSRARAAYAEKELDLPTRAVVKGGKSGRSKEEFRGEKERALEEEVGPALEAVHESREGGWLKVVRFVLLFPSSSSFSTSNYFPNHSYKLLIGFSLTIAAVKAHEARYGGFINTIWRSGGRLRLCRRLGGMCTSMRGVWCLRFLG
jgi:hypothetical protein